MKEHLFTTPIAHCSKKTARFKSLVHTFTCHLTNTNRSYRLRGNVAADQQARKQWAHRLGGYARRSQTSETKYTAGPNRSIRCRIRTGTLD